MPGTILEESCAIKEYVVDKSETIQNYLEKG